MVNLTGNGNSAFDYRYVPMHRVLRELLESRRKMAAPFLRPLGKNNLRISLIRAARRAKIEGLATRRHDLRQTFASRLAQKGASFYTIGKLLGHRGLKSTQIYAHLTPESLDGVVGMLDF